MDIRQLAEERDRALSSLNKKRVEAYCRKYGIPVPDNEIIFWAGVHKAIFLMESATPGQKEKSRQWLIKHGFQPQIM